MVRSFLVLSAITVVTGCGSDGSGTPRSMVAATADALTTEYAADPAAFLAKYGPCRVEISGIVDFVRSDDVNESVIHVRFKNPSGREKADAVDVAFHLSQEPKLLPLVPGSTVTVRGNTTTDGLKFVSGELVTAEPGVATSVSAIVAEAKDPAAFRRKYEAAGLRLVGKIVEVRRRPTTVPQLTEVDVTIYDGVDQDKVVVCRVRTSERADQRYRVVSLKRPDTVTVVGRVVTADPAAKEILILEHCHIVP